MEGFEPGDVLLEELGREVTLKMGAPQLTRATCSCTGRTQAITPIQPFLQEDMAKAQRRSPRYQVCSSSVLPRCGWHCSPLVICRQGNGASGRTRTPG